MKKMILGYKPLNELIMKKLYSFLCATVALLSVSSCQVDMIDAEKGNNEKGYTFSATIGEDTKTVLQDNVKVFWAKGDNITVFDAENMPVTFTGQQTEAAATADFYAASYNPAEKAYAVYPENADAEFDGNIISGLYISAEQTAVAGGFDPLYTVAVGKEAEKGKLTFKNVHSLVKFTVSGDKMPKTVSFTNGGDKAVAGNVSYNVSDKTAYVEDTESASLSVVLKPSAGEGFEAGKTYYIAFCADGDLEDMTLAFDDVVVKEVEGVKEDVSNGKIFDLGTVAFPAEKEMVEVTANYLYGYYYGGMGGSYNYTLILSDNGLSGESLYPNSKYFSIDIYSEVAVGDGAMVVPYGTYTFDPDDTYNPGTFTNEYSYVIITNDSSYTEYLFVSGTMTVTENHIDLVVEAEDGTVYHVTYDGSLDFGATSGDDYVSNLDDDVEIESETGYFYAENYGDYYEVGKINYMISIFADGETFSGESLMFEILTDNTTGITGNYAALTEEATELYDCFLPGDYEVEDGYLYPYCSWYMTVTEGYMDGEGYAPLVDGELMITEEDGVYTFTFDCYDDAGHNICGTIQAVGIDENGEPMAYTKSSSDVKKGKKNRTGWSVKTDDLRWTPKKLFVK